MGGARLGCFVFFFNDTATTEIYTLSLPDALPIFVTEKLRLPVAAVEPIVMFAVICVALFTVVRSEEHTSELQSQSNLVCRLLLEKKKTYFKYHPVAQSVLRLTGANRPRPSHV